MTSHPDHKADIQKMLALKTGSYSFTNRIHTVNGELRYVQTIAHVIEGEDSAKKLIGTMQDITEHKHMQEELYHKSQAWVQS